MTEANTGTLTQAVKEELLEVVTECEEGGYSFSYSNYFCGFDISEEASNYILELLKKDLRNKQILKEY